MHCKCGRQGTASGRHAPRSFNTMEHAPTWTPVAQHAQVALDAQVAQDAQIAQVARVQLPVAMPPKLTVETFAGKPWHNRALQDINQASSSVTVASYIYDHPQLHKAIMRQLNGKPGFKCDVYVDKSQFELGGAKRMGQMLRGLANAGADVYLCVGSSNQAKFGQPGHNGSMHMKAILIDHQIAYHGSANFTWSSEKNFELVMRMMGPPVQDIAEAVEALKACPLTVKL